jgi:hypothetical protein
LIEGPPGVLERLTTDEWPDIGVKAADLLLDLQERLGIADDRIYLQPIPPCET